MIREFLAILICGSIATTMFFGWVSYVEEMQPVAVARLERGAGQ